MSRDNKRTWSEKQTEGNDNGQAEVIETMQPNSRENSSSRKKSKPNTQKSNKPKKPVELETDPTILQRRQKQIDYGKNTVGYANYTQQVPQEQRTKEHPKTPDKYIKYSRRGWDMLIKIWRKNLHEFDEENKDGVKEESESNDDEDTNYDDVKKEHYVNDDVLLDDGDDGLLEDYLQ